MGEPVTSSAGSYTVHSEARGPHWIAWLTAGSEPRPVRDVVLVGETREEAESRARQWLQDASGQGYL